MKKAILLLAGTLAFAPVLLAQPELNRQPDSTRSAAWERFNAQHREAGIRWNGRTGLPRSLSGGLSTSYTGSPEQAARAFLSEHAELFGWAPGLEGLSLSHVKENRGISHVSFQQYHRGVPVEDAVYKVHIRPGGQVDMANGFYYPDINLSVNPSLTGKHALRLALEDLGTTPSPGNDSTPTLVVLPLQEGGHALAWKVELAYWLYFVDARSGDILSKSNRVPGAHGVERPATHRLPKTTTAQVQGARGADFPVTGTGTVYPTHPGLSSLEQRDLPRLNGDGPLTGTYVNVENEFTANAFSADNTFLFAPESSHLDEVNLYYHIDTFRNDYINTLGSLSFTQITAHSHSESNTSIPSACQIASCFYLSNGLYFASDFLFNTNSFAREDKVIYHEYTHAVFYDVTGDRSTKNDEEGAINEGISDYFPGAFTGRPKILEWALAPHPNPDNLIRDMDAPDIQTYAQYISIKNDPLVGQVELHMGGEFFSSILWELRAHPDLTPALTDQLVWDALYRLSPEPDFLEFRDALMASAGFAQYTRKAAIQDTFFARGIGESMFPIQASIDGPGNLFQGQSGLFTATVSFGDSPYQYHWFYRHYEDFSWTAVQQSPSLNSYLHTAGEPIGEEIKVEISNNEDRIGEAVHFFTIIGSFEFETNSGLEEPVPNTFFLKQNYPNPFNPGTTIEFGLEQPAQVLLEVFSVIGQKVATLVNETRTAGSHSVRFDASRLASGVYVARLVATDAVSPGRSFEKIIRMNLIK